MAERIPIVRPIEAIDYFRRKGFAFGFAWQDVWQEEHVRAFTVAKAMSRDLLEDIRGAVDRALAEGRTLDQFRTELRPLLEAKGWWGRRPMVDPKTGLERVVQLGSPRRLRTIFDVNMRMAYQAGRWQRMERNSKAFPYVRYVSAGDARVRPQHQAWHGVIRPVGDSWWDTHYPPCGWNCRCTAVPVNDRIIERRGWEVTDRPPAFLPQRYVNPRTGEVSAIEAGISPGFNYNVGKAYLQDLTPRPAPGPGATLMMPGAEVPESGEAPAAPPVTSVDALTDEQREVIRAYTSDDANPLHEKINKRLRSRRSRQSEKPTRVDQAIATLDTAFERARLPNAVTVYRGISGDHAAMLLQSNLKKGDLYVDAGFLSTSRSQKIVTDTFANPLFGRNRIVLKIFAPEGSRALDISSLSRISKVDEKEVLFARSTRMRVRRWIPERRIYELEVIPDDGGSL